MLKTCYNIALWKKNLIALFLGVIVGICFREHVAFFQPIGQAFINLLKMMVIPLVFITLMHSIINLTNTKKIATLAFYSIFLFIFTTVVAIVISIIAAEVIKPGNGVGIVFPTYVPSDSAKLPSLLVTLLNIIPSNIFKPFIEENILQVVFLSVFTAIILTKLKTDKSIITNIVNISSELILGMVNFIVQLMPIGIFALLAYSSSVIGYDLLLKLSIFVGLVCCLCLVQMFVIYPLLLKFTGNNIKEFFKKASPAMFTSFALSSSSASLPVTMNSAKRLNISEEARSFIIPLGSTINMSGAAIQQTVITIFIAQIVGFDLHFYHYIVILLTTLVATIGTAGIPSAGLIMTSVVLNALGLPVEGIALVAGVDRIIDMITSSVNVMGDLVIAQIVSTKSKSKE